MRIGRAICSRPDAVIRERMVGSISNRACAHFRSTQLGSAPASPAPTWRLPRRSCPGMSQTTGANTISSLMLDYYQDHAIAEALIEAIRIAAAGVGVGRVAWLRQELSTGGGVRPIYPACWWARDRFGSCS